MLFASFPTKLWRRHLDDTVGREVATVFHDEGLWVPGSNAWAVGGARTASGRPMVGGDPHRSFESPNVYVQVRLTCPPEGIDVAGFTFPGVPGVQHFAHAGEVAWGITNAMADYQDVYEEHLERRGDEVWWEGPEGWARAQAHREVVEVRDGDAEEVEVVVTGNGPVFHGEVGDDHVLSLRAASIVLGVARASTASSRCCAPAPAPTSSRPWSAGSSRSTTSSSPTCTATCGTASSARSPTGPRRTAGDPSRAGTRPTSGPGGSTTSRTPRSRPTAPW